MAIIFFEISFILNWQFHNWWMKKRNWWMKGGGGVRVREPILLSHPSDFFLFLCT